LQKIGILDLSLIKLLQNEQGCIFLPHSVVCAYVISFHKLLFRCLCSWQLFCYY